MHRLLLFAATLALGAHEARGQAGVVLRELTGVRALALGGPAVALEGALLPNPAAGTSVPTTVHLYADRAFGLTELQQVGVQAHVATSFASLRAEASSFGYENFRATRVSLGAAYPFRFGTTRQVAAGARIAYDHLALGNDYGTAGAISLDLGLRTMLTEQVAGGVRATNVLRSKVGSREPLPRRLTIGLAYVVDPRITLVGDVEQEVRQPAAFSAGVEARVAGPLIVRGGGGSGPNRLSLGFGVEAGRLQAEGAFVRHEALGWTPAVSLGARL